MAMKDPAAALTARTSAESARRTAAKAAEATALQGRYGQIGISAVAAAARYQGEAKNPAYAPAPTRWRDYDREDAAA